MMIKNLAITPPVLGRISIGHVVEKNGKRLPEKDDQFTVTTQVQTKDGWVLHPMDKTLREGIEGEKLRAIPIRLLFNDPDLNFRAQFSAFDRSSGRPLCTGDGESCRRATSDGLQSLTCPGPDSCEFGQRAGCKPYGRLNVVLGEDDPLGTFIFRTTGYNSIRTLAARLKYFSAVSGGLLSCLPLELRIRAKSTTQSHRAPIYYVDICQRIGESLEKAISQAKQIDSDRKASGFDQAALDLAAAEGFTNGVFEDGEEEIPAVVEEFYGEEPASETAGVKEGKAEKATLKDKLTAKAARAFEVTP